MRRNNSVLSPEDLLTLEINLKKWHQSSNSNQKEYIYRQIKKYIKLCNSYHNNEIKLTDLINKYYIGMQQFYLIRDKVKKVINNDWNFSLFEKKSTRPKRIQYKYKKEYGTGIYEFYYLTKIGHFKYQDKTVKHNIKTLMNWNNIFNAKTSKYKNPAKHPRYEVEKLGKIQHDIKVLTKDLTGLDRNYYVFDFIDEKSRFAIGYIYDSKGVTNAIGATRKAIQRFADIGIKVTRIRTDNGTEYISNLHKHPTRKISEFTEFLNKKG